MKGAVTVKTDGATRWDYARLSNNINFEEPDAALRIKRIKARKPEERDIFSTGDASHLQRLHIEASVRFAPSAEGHTKITVTYRRHYTIYAANVKVAGFQLASWKILPDVKNGTTESFNEAFEILLRQIEQGAGLKLLQSSK